MAITHNRYNTSSNCELSPEGTRRIHNSSANVSGSDVRWETDDSDDGVVNSYSSEEPSSESCHRRLTGKKYRSFRTEPTYIDNRVKKKLRHDRRNINKLMTEEQLEQVQRPSVQPLIQMTAHQPVEQPEQMLTQHEALVQQMLVQMQQRLDQMQQQIAQQPTQVMNQQPVPLPVQMTEQPTQQSAQQSTKFMGHDSMRQSSRWLEKQPQHVLEPMARPTSGDGSENTYRQRLVSDPHPITEGGGQSSSGSSTESAQMLSPRIYHRLDSIRTVKHRSFERSPRRALVHRFDNMDRQTVVAYGDEKLQYWDTVEREMVGVWNGDQENIHIEQAEPISTSVMAIVSNNIRKTEHAPKTGRLFFMDVNWSADRGRFATTPVREWTEEGYSIRDIAVVCGIDSRSVSDYTLMSMFTGGLTDGSVFRRIFDISESEAAIVTEVKMANNHHGRISALCHIEAMGSVVSGGASGKVCVSDHLTGKRLQTYDLASDCTVASIVSCPYNTGLFMASCCEPTNELLVFDTRDKCTDAPVLRFGKDDIAITSRYNRPAWNRDNGLIFAPAQRFDHNSKVAVVEVWDPRFTKSCATTMSTVHGDEGDIFSVDFTNSARGGRSEMITASELSIGFSSLSISNH